GRIQEDEKALFAMHRMQVGTSGQGRQEESFEDEARRCLHCDCLKKISCALRKYAKEYGARQFAYRGAGRPRIEASHRNDDVLYEPGKCIRCGLCVEITERAGEALGLGFVERGFDVRVRVPFGRSLEEGLSVCARACAEACPTGALALYNEEEVAPTSPGAEEVAPTSPGAEEGDS
ncbi:MAG: hypothetical protein GWP08_13685, partial [Nitrospiraceae bacterium]|nr:hypothetical protein [Nitrospiraceae bacterium]